MTNKIELLLFSIPLVAFGVAGWFAMTYYDRWQVCARALQKVGYKLFAENERLKDENTVLRGRLVMADSIIQQLREEKQAK